MHLSKLTLLLALAHVSAFAGAPSAKTPAAVAPTSTSFADAGSLSEYWFGKDNAWDSFYDDVQQWKKDNHIPISMGAHHWWNVDRDQFVYGDGYGVPGLRGTYFYWLNFDPTLKFSGEGFVDEVGIHVQGRIRDHHTKLRSFYNRNYWTYEAYAFAKTDIGTFKAGQIVQQFCIPWDNSWWEGVSYFDEYRLNPSIGVSWDNSWKLSETWTMPTAAQFYFQGDQVSGAMPNSSAANSGFVERNTAMLRIVPTWKPNNDWTIAWGLAGLSRQIKGGEKAGLDDRQLAWDTDLTISYKNLSVWGQYIDSHGVITPSRYVSNGPSSRQNSLSGGVNYKMGPVSAHVNYSKGWDHDPDGDQFVFQPGITFQISKSLTLYTEYVRWDLTNSKGKTSVWGDGFQIALVWNL